MTEQITSFLDDLAVQHISNRIDAVIGGFTLAWLEDKGLTEDYLEVLDREAQNLFETDRLTSLYLSMGKQSLEARLANIKQGEESEESTS